MILRSLAVLSLLLIQALTGCTKKETPLSSTATSFTAVVNGRSFIATSVTSALTTNGINTYRRIQGTAANGRSFVLVIRTDSAFATGYAFLGEDNSNQTLTYTSVAGGPSYPAISGTIGITANNNLETDLTFTAVCKLPNVDSTFVVSNGVVLNVKL
jgi:hypothetical protein